MIAIRWKALVAAVLMAAGAVAGHWARPTSFMADTRAKVDLQQLVPKSFGEWTLDEHVPVQLIAPDLEASLNAIYNQVLSRTYVNSRGQRIMLSIAYGGDQSDGTSAHRPEVCYPAQGFEILASKESRLDVASEPIPVRRLVARLGARVEPITYWIVVGDKIAITGTQQKWDQIRYGMHGVVPDGMLVRVSNIGDNSSEAYALQDAFVQKMVAAVQPGLRSRLVGGSAS